MASQERPGVRKRAECGGAIPVPGLGRECWAVNGVFAGRWLLPTNRRAGQDGESGGRSTIRGRLAFMKAEFEISNAQEQLWEAFAEALRDFLKARSRPDIGGPVGTAGLPERLAMRERDLTSDLESLRQRKAIIETFYAG